LGAYAHLARDDRPLVVHVITSPHGRGAQRAARMLVDRLNETEGTRHLLLCLFDGPAEVEVDLMLGHSKSRYPTTGFDPRLALALRKLLVRIDPAVVVAHGGDPMKYSLPAVVGTRRRLVYCVIGTYAGSPTTLQGRVWRRVMAGADLLVAVGPEVLAECVGPFRMVPARAIMIPNGRDASEYRPRSEPPDSPDVVLIFVGALTPQKQPERFVELVHHLRGQGREVRAMMVGDGPLSGRLAPRALAEGIELLGPRSDVPELLRHADVLVFTSRPTGEGMPGVLIEAGLSGLPVVSTPVPGAAAVLCDGQTGLIVQDSIAALAEAVGWLLDEPAGRAAMGASARHRCEAEFTLDLMVDRWRDALHPLLTAQARTARRGGWAAARRACAFLMATRSR
jgi:glycosyltransferase involved in cell wall biosynthesis